MLADVVRVELVGGTVWDWLLPGAAILVSLFSLGLTLWFRRSDQARVELRIRRAVVGTTPLSHYWVVKATNTGRTGTTQVDSVVLTAKGLDEQFVMVKRIAGVAALPWRLGPGESESEYFDLEQVERWLQKNGKTNSDVIAIASTGHGECRAKNSA